jgi:hypothetical protein
MKTKPGAKKTDGRPKRATKAGSISFGLGSAEREKGLKREKGLS